MSEQFYWKKQLLVQRDQLLENIGRSVFKANQLPPNFADLPKAFHLNDTLLEQIYERKKTLREARTLVMNDLDVLDQESAAIEAELDEKVGPFAHDLDKLKLNLAYAEDRQHKGMRLPADHATQIEDLSCKIQALELRVNAGSKHYRDKLEEVEHRAKPLRTRLQRLNRNIEKTFREEQQLEYQVQRRFRELGYSFFENRRDPATFEETYLQLDQLITQLADYRHPPAQAEEKHTPKQESPFWKWVLAAFLLGFLVMVLFRTQYQRSHVDFGQVAKNFHPQEDDYRFFVDLTRQGLGSWHQEIPNLESLPGGSVFRGIGSQDVLSFLISKQQFGQGELRFCGLQLRKTPARFGYRLVQQGWRRYATELGYEALSKGSLVWLILTHREYLLLEKDHLEQLQIFLDNPESLAFLLEQKLPPFERYQNLLQGLDHLQLSLKQNHFTLSLEPSERIGDADLRRQWLAQFTSQLTQPLPVDMTFSQRGLVFEGVFDPQASPFQQGNMQAFIYQQLDGLLAAQPKKPKNKPNEVVNAQAVEASPNDAVVQGLKVYRPTSNGLNPISSMMVGGDVSDLISLPKRDQVLVLDAVSRKLMLLNLKQGTLGSQQITDLDSAPMNRVLGQDLGGFTPGKLFPTPDEDFAIMLEGRLPKNGRARMILFDLNTLEPVAAEEMPDSNRLPSSATWSSDGHDLFVGIANHVESPDRIQVLGFRREGHVLALSRIIRSEAETTRTFIGGLAMPDHTPDLFFHDLMNQTVMRYKFRVDSSLRTETVKLTDVLTTKSAKSAQALRVAQTMVLSRNGNHAVVVEGRRIRDNQQEFGVYLVDLIAPQASATSRISLPARPAALSRMPLSNTFWTTLPQTGQLVEIRLLPQKQTLAQQRAVSTPGLAPTLITSDKWGQYLVVGGIVDKEGFPQP